MLAKLPQRDSVATTVLPWHCRGDTEIPKNHPRKSHKKWDHDGRWMGGGWDMQLCHGIFV